jgi:hypothetical protein
VKCFRLRPIHIQPSLELRSLWCVGEIGTEIMAGDSGGTPREMAHWTGRRWRGGRGSNDAVTGTSRCLPIKNPAGTCFRCGGTARISRSRPYPPAASHPLAPPSCRSPNSRRCLAPRRRVIRGGADMAFIAANSGQEEVVPGGDVFVQCC